MAKTLLVLGNGFDLKCGLKTTVRDFFESAFYGEKRDACEAAIQYIHSNAPKYSIQPKTITDLYELFGKLSFWDLFFSMQFFMEPEKHERYGYWFNLEERLKEFVLGAVGGSGIYKEIIDIEWPDITTYGISKDRVYCLLLQLYLQKKSGSLRVGSETKGKLEYDSDALALFLFEQLKDFERCFGRYIEEQQNQNVQYVGSAKKFIEELTKDHALVGIHTFNYTNLDEIVPNDCKIWHVNGDITNPIFGIDFSMTDNPFDGKVTFSDLSSNSGKRWYRFSKTYRRLELEGNGEYYPTKYDFSRVVVFGHSMNKQDYNYFYALFNRLGFRNDRTTRNSYEVVFLYSPRGGLSKDEAKHRIIDRALPLLQGYNNEILHEPNFRLMDILYGNGAIQFVEAPIITLD